MNHLLIFLTICVLATAYLSVPFILTFTKSGRKLLPKIDRWEGVPSIIVAIFANIFMYTWPVSLPLYWWYRLIRWSLEVILEGKGKKL